MAQDWLDAGIPPELIRLELYRLHVLDALWMNARVRSGQWTRDGMLDVCVLKWQEALLPPSVMPPAP